MCGVLYVFLQSAQWQAQSPTTRPLIFMQLNWPLYITCKVTRQLASNNHCLHQYLPSGYFCWKRSKRNPKYFTFSSLLHGRRTNSFFGLVVVTLKRWSQMLLQKVPNSQQNLLSRRVLKFERRVINRAPSGLLLCQLIKPLTQRFSQILAFALKALFLSQLFLSLS